MGGKRQTNSFVLQTKVRNGIDAADMETVYIRTTDNVAPTIVDFEAMPYDPEDPYNNDVYMDSSHGLHDEDGFLPLASVTQGSIEANQVAHSNNGYGISGGTTDRYGECTASPKGISQEWPYEWEMTRRQGTAGAGGVRTWDLFSGTMVLRSRWANDAPTVVFLPGILYVDADSDGWSLAEDTVFNVDFSLMVGGAQAVITTVGTPQVPEDSTPVVQYNAATGKLDVTVYGDMDGVGWDGIHVLLPVTGRIGGTTVSAMGQLPIVGKRKGQQGNPGTSPEVYSLRLDTPAVHWEGDFSGTRHFTPTSYELALYRSQAAGTTRLDSIPQGMSIYYYAYTASGTLIDSGQSALGRLLSDTELDYTTVPAYVEYVLYAAATNAGNEIDRVRMTALHDVQRMLVPAGKYTSKLYQRTDYTTPLVLHEGSYSFLVADSNNVGTATRPRYEAPGDRSTVWRKATEFEVMLTKMLFAPFAQLGGFVVYGDFFFSQYGTLYSRKGSVAVGAGNCQTLYGLDYAENISDDETDWAEWLANDNGPAAVPYGFFDPNDPAAASVGEDELKFRPAKLINAATGEEWSAGGNFAVDAQGGVTMKNATIRNAAFFHRIHTFHLNTGNLDYYVFANQAYTPGDMPQFLADTFILTGDNTRTAAVMVGLPDPSDCPGMRLKIVRGYHTTAHAAPLLLTVCSDEQTFETATDGTRHWVNGIYAPDDQSFGQQLAITALKWVELTVGSALTLISSTEGDVTDQFLQWVVTGKG